MKTNITNQKLLQIDNELQMILPTAVGMLLMGKIQSFYKINQIKIQTVQEKVKLIQKEHLMFNEDGTIKFPKEEPAPGNPKLPMFKLGHTEEQLQKEYKELMDQIVAIEL